MFTAPPNRPVFLVDASIYIFQAHFSPNLEIVADDGRDISALYGFAQFLLRFLRQARPQHLAIAFDESLFCGFRHTLYPDYKSNRVLPDEDLARQLQACADLCRALGIQAFGSKVYEADDIIGTLSARMRMTGEVNEPDICIVTRDKDLAQLLRTDGDCIWDFSASLRRYRKDIIARYSVRPEQFPCYLGLIGDPIDCIPGVPGIGPVAASCLLRHFESVPLLYENLQDVGGLSYRGASKGAALLSQYEAEAHLSRQLATIVQDVDLSTESFSQINATDILWQQPDVAAVNDLLGTQGFEAIARERFVTLLHSMKPEHLMIRETR